MRKRAALFLIPLLLAATAVLIGWKFLKPIEVAALAPEKNIRVQVYGLGTLGVHTLSKRGFKVSGILFKLNADHGDRMRKGDVLAQLDTAEQEGRVAKAAASVERAKAAVGLILGVTLLTFVKDRFPRRVIMLPEDAMLLGLVVIGVCLLASGLGVRLALKIDPALALGG